jgi:phosphonate transport system substrate-binding protein
VISLLRRSILGRENSSGAASPMPILRRSLLAACAFAPAVARAQVSTVWSAFPERGRRPWGREMPILRVGIHGGEVHLGNFGQYEAYTRLLENTFGVSVTLYRAGEESALAQAFAGQQVEFAPMSQLGYARAWLETNGNVEPLLTIQAPDGSTGIYAVIIVRSDFPFLDLDMLRRGSLAWVAEDSLEGYLVPRAELLAQGIDPERHFARTGFAGGHEQAILAVLGRRFDAGVTWVSGIGEESEGFSRSTMREMAEPHMITMRDIRIIWRSSKIPYAPIVIRKDTPQAFKDDIAAFHLALPRSHPEIYAAISGGGAGWVRAEAAAYDRFIAILRDQDEQRRRELAEQRRLAAEEQQRQFMEAAQKRREEAQRRRRERAERLAERRRRRQY